MAIISLLIINNIQMSRHCGLCNSSYSCWVPSFNTFSFVPQLLAPFTPQTFVFESGSNIITIPSGARFLRFFIVGGGEGGAAGGGAGGSNGGGGGGGGRGLFVTDIIPVVGNSISYIVGAGGAGGTNPNNLPTNGFTGGNTSFTMGPITETGTGGNPGVISSVLSTPNGGHDGGGGGGGGAGSGWTRKSWSKWIPGTIYLWWDRGKWWEWN